nr:zinc knuckle CX2CX4HX4C [Tanacetum cinerariifolium]
KKKQIIGDEVSFDDDVRRQGCSNGDEEVISWGLDGENGNKDVDMHKEEEKDISEIVANIDNSGSTIPVKSLFGSRCLMSIYWSLRGISTLASKLGKPLMMDSMIAAMCHNGTGRAGYVRVLIEMDANKGMQDQIEVVYKDIMMNIKRTKFVKVKYVWRPIMCNTCKVFGHIDRECKKKNEQAVKLDQDHGNFKQANNFGNERILWKLEEENELIKGANEFIKQMVRRMSPEIMPKFKKSENNNNSQEKIVEWTYDMKQYFKYRWKLVNKEKDKSNDEEDVIEKNDAYNLNVIADEISGRDTQLII